MKFSAREDIEAPLADVWPAITDFGRFERQVLRRGAEVERLDAGPMPGAGNEWRLRFDFRGKQRKMTALITRFEPETSLELACAGSGMEGTVTAEVLPLAKQRTRLFVEVDFVPKTIAARVLIQTMRLAKSNMSQRFKSRVSSFARDIEDRVGAQPSLARRGSAG
ncbi:SRPBCC family protein [Tropicimonas sp. IMCC34011]|uniref:SRPBCC family protein n=1 Tax=Tropicimonas sp. IMCC34011 TaxID=2248759 RepID=UPI000E22DBE1|nr:SRPBCC family protein [Tropicimonas sp. IMCC34011]